MRLRAITLRNVRRFTTPVRVEGISDGLNLLCEPNERGKSTLFDAVEALFLLPHGSQARDAKALRPHAGGAPEVSVEVETAEGRFTISKRWLSRSHARVTEGERLVAQADAAEAWVADLLGGGTGAPSGLVWVRQGLTSLEAGTPAERAAALEARRDLLSSVTGEVEAMTGGRRMDMAIARCRAERDLYATGRGKPKVGGPWKAALDRVAALTEERDDLGRTVAALHETLAARQRLRRDLDEIAAPEAVAERRARLEAAGAAQREAERHAAARDTAARKAEAAAIAARTARERLGAFRAAGQEFEAARAAVTAAEAAARIAEEALARARAAQREATESYDAAEARRIAAATERRRAAQVRAAAEGAALRAETQRRLDGAVAARAEMEAAIPGARTGPDADTLAALESLATQAAGARAARDAGAARIAMHYLPGREGSVRLSGTALSPDTELAIPAGASLEIEGVGRLDIRAAPSGGDDEVAAAERALDRALEASGLTGISEARAAARTRAEAERRVAAARALADSLAPDGIATLRETLAGIPEARPDADAPTDPETAETAAAETELARDAALARRDAAAARTAETQAEAAGAEAARRGAADRAERAEQAMVAFSHTAGPELASEAEAAEGAAQDADAMLAETAREAPDLEATRAALDRAQSVEAAARAAVLRLTSEQATLNERIAQRSGAAVEERLADCEGALELAEADLARIVHEVAVLDRLEAALEAARREARDRYFAPIAAELAPLIGLIWPEAELVWADDRLLPSALIRDGHNEPVEILSDGTQEQVAVLVRLAFARLLAKSGRHAPVILDDALVFSDDDRIERMFDALHRQANDVQIIVLSCRQRAFRALGGRTLQLTEIEE